MGRLNQNESGGDEGEAWLLSYADMMTLIACFFILMMAFANFDPAGFTKKTKVVSQHFNKDKNKSSDIKLTQLTEEIARHPEIEKMTKITKENGQLVINFSGSTVFEKEVFKISQEGMLNLDIMIEIIKKINSRFKVIAEGHSDETEGQNPKMGLSVWGLSGARAASVIERFEYHGFDTKELSVIAKGDSSPLFKSFDEEGKPNLAGQKMNQRVSIKLLTLPNKDQKKVKLGLGVYFD